MPIIATTHLKEEFGDVSDDIQAIKYKGRQQHDKHTFSMIGVDNIKVRVDVEHTMGRKNAVIYGAETHVAVKQTCLDLIEHGFQVHVLADSVSACNQHDHNIGIEALKQEGVRVTSF